MCGKGKVYIAEKCCDEVDVEEAAQRSAEVELDTSRRLAARR